MDQRKMNKVLNILTEEWLTTNKITCRCEGMHWITVYMILEKLRDRGLVEKDDREVAIFWRKKSRWL